MAKTTFFLILSDIVETQYEHDARARTILWSFCFHRLIFSLKDILYNTYFYIDYFFGVPNGRREGPIYCAQSSNKLFDDFIGFYYFKFMAYVPHAPCVGLGS
jgi:hypothetical protein